MLFPVSTFDDHNDHQIGKNASETNVDSVVASDRENSALSESTNNSNGTNSIDVLFMLSTAYVLSAASILFMSVSCVRHESGTFHNDVCGWYGVIATCLSAPHVASAYVQFHAYLSARKMRCTFTDSVVWGLTLLQEDSSESRD